MSSPQQPRDRSLYAVPYDEFVADSAGDHQLAHAVVGQQHDAPAAVEAPAAGADGDGD